MPDVPPPVDLLGVPIHPVSATSLVDSLVAWGEAPATRPRTVFYVNVHAMNLAHEDPAFAEALRAADLVFCDGFGVKWGAKLAGVALPHRLTPPDWIDALLGAGQRVYALGDEPGVAEEFQAEAARRHPGYRDAGAHHGFFAKEGAETDAVVDAINASGATHLLLGLGMPLQERWALACAPRLRVKTIITVGALFRWYAGVEQRAPRWMTDHGLEWLARLAQHPRRHFRRYVIGNPRFVARVVRSRIR